jgi:hypothetical protein
LSLDFSDISLLVYTASAIFLELIPSVFLDKFISQDGFPFKGILSALFCTSSTTHPSAKDTCRKDIHQDRYGLKSQNWNKFNP